MFLVVGDPGAGCAIQGALSVDTDIFLCAGLPLLTWEVDAIMADLSNSEEGINGVMGEEGEEEDFSSSSSSIICWLGAGRSASTSA